MSGAGVEELYKNYGVLADAKDKIGEVSPYAIAPDAASTHFSPL